MRRVGHVACMTEQKCKQGFSGKTWRRTDCLEDGSIDERTILKTDLKEIGWEGIYWIDLAQDRDKWWNSMNSAVKFHVP